MVYTARAYGQERADVHGKPGLSFTLKMGKAVYCELVRKLRSQIGKPLNTGHPAWKLFTFEGAFAQALNSGPN